MDSDSESEKSGDSPPEGTVARISNWREAVSFSRAVHWKLIFIFIRMIIAKWLHSKLIVRRKIDGETLPYWQSLLWSFSDFHSGFVEAQHDLDSDWQSDRTLCQSISFLCSCHLHMNLYNIHSIRLKCYLNSNISLGDRSLSPLYFSGWNQERVISLEEAQTCQANCGLSSGLWSALVYLGPFLKEIKSRRRG